MVFIRAQSLTRWLSVRIHEIERFTRRLPSIAVLVNLAVLLEPPAEGLSEAFSKTNIRTIGLSQGPAIGPKNEVRVFDVEEIKGLEFEAVFFVDIDKPAQESGFVRQISMSVRQGPRPIWG